MAANLSVTEAADYLGVSRTTVWSMMKDGRLPASPNPLDKRQKLIPLSSLVGLRLNLSRGSVGRPWPKTIGIYDGPVEVPSSEIEEYMEAHWHKP